MKRRLGFEGCLTINSIERKGGLALLWRYDSEIVIENYSHRHISARVEDPKNNTTWLFIGLYGELETCKRRITWDMLQE